MSQNDQKKYRVFLVNNDDDETFEKEINRFLKDHKDVIDNLKDIKFSTCISEEKVLFAALIIYEEKFVP